MDDSINKIDGIKTRKRFRWLWIILLSPFCLLLFISILLYIPPFQNYVVKEAARYASEASGMQISIGRVNLAFPIDLVVRDVEVLSGKDTVLTVNRLRVELQMLPLLKKEFAVDGIRLQEVYVNTLDLLPTLLIRGSLGEFYLASHGIDLELEQAVVNQAYLHDADVFLALKDTLVSEDTTSASLYWKVDLNDLSLRNIKLDVCLNDTTTLMAGVGGMQLLDGHIDLKSEAYQLGKFAIHKGRFSYDVGMSDSLEMKSHPQGINTSHIALDNIALDMDSLLYHGRDIRLVLNRLEGKEKSGLQLLSTKGRIQADMETIRIPEFRLQTTDSYLDFTAQADWNVLESDSKAKLHARLLAELGKQDMLQLIGHMPDSFVLNYPNAPMQLRAGVDGNLGRLRLTALQARLEEAFTASASGEMHHLLDSLRRSGNLGLRVEGNNLHFLTALVDSTGAFAIPRGIKLSADATISPQRYEAKMQLLEGIGKVSAEAHYQVGNQAYQADVRIDSLSLHDFLPKDSVYWLSAGMQVKGVGMDIYSPTTKLELDAALDTLHYGHLFLSDMELKAVLDKGAVEAMLASDNPLLRMKSRLQGHISKQHLSGALQVDVDEADLQQMRLVEQPLKVGIHLQMDAESDWQKLIALKGGWSGLRLTNEKKTYRPKDLELEAYTAMDSTYMRVGTGDLKVKLRGKKHLETILGSLSDFAVAFMKQAEDKQPDWNQLKPYLPELWLEASSGMDNPLNNYLLTQGLQYQDLSINMNTSPERGIRGRSHLYALRNDSLTVDTMRVMFLQDTLGIRLFAQVKNAPTNKRVCFDARLHGRMQERSINMELEYRDAKDSLGLHLGVGVKPHLDALRFYLFPEQPVIAYQPFHLNDSNHVDLYRDGRIEGDISLLNKEYAGVNFYSTSNEAASHDLTLELRQIDIGSLMKMLPYMPDVSGVLSSDIHYQKMDEQMLLAAETRVENLVYEKNSMGNIANSTVYLPKDWQTHFVDTRLMRNEQEILAAQGDYISRDEGSADVDLSLLHFPLEVVNGFIPDALVALRGDVDGELKLSGSLSRPVVNGQVAFDSVQVSSEVYGMRFHLDNRPVMIEKSNMVFDKFTIDTEGKSPFAISGNVNFSRLDRVNLDLRMMASEFELLNAPRRKNSLLYGKVYLDFFSTLRGTLDDLRMRGNISVLGKTDVGYVLKDSPLTVEDRLGDLVTFVDFNDTVKVDEVERRQYALGGLDMLLNLQVNEGAQVRVDLSEDRSSYVELRGGGNLSMQYNPQGDLLLSGRYTLTDGQMKYELPIIPLKTFTVKKGSYVEFTGNPMNPYMNIVATERMRSTVTENNVPRTVAFDVGVIVTNTLENMGLEFTLSAPEDMSVQNQLAAMSVEERGKQAVAMLATGIYLGAGGGTSGGFNANNALNSFLQSEIASIAGNALKTVDINLGVEDATSSDGSSRTDYSFRFAKRFWNNRLSVVIGGRISSGNDAADAGRSDSFIDDVSLEWRLDDSGTRYVRLFHNKNFESVLEGEIIETGVGIVLRRKMSKLGELFIFKKKKNQLPQRR